MLCNGLGIREKSGLLKDFSLFMEELKRLFSDSNARYPHIFKGP
jgi:hypothetical protein